jgi:FKBP-type peptidyl-prolyl cis-trans isomerase FkpA
MEIILSETITTTTGLQYIDTVTGEGAQAQGGEVAVVHYTGWLYDAGEKGKKFDSSVDRGQPFKFPLGAGRVIQGWDQGVKGMKIGGKRTLIIPSALGYGARGAPGAIPPNAKLIFDVELLGLE